MKNKIWLISSALLICSFSRLSAGDVDSKNQITTTAPELPAFRHGGHEVELTAGAMVSVGGKDLRKPELNYAVESLRFGWMLDDVYGPSLWHGNDEFLIEGFGGEVFKGPGNALGGGMLLLRHNWVQDGWKLIPYVQIGAGGLGNDIYHDQTQRLVGQGFEFILHAGFGVRYMINNHWALSLEGDYRHISNADMADRNLGLNSLGGMLGINYFF